MAITRKEALLKSISGGESANVSPITREEQYLSYIAGESNSYPSQPITREEVYLDKIAKSGISGGGSGVNVQSLSVTENGTYTAPSGVAYSPVFVNVASSGGGVNKLAQVADKSVTEITEADLQGATSIGGRMFKLCKNLVSVTIPSSVKAIEGEAFSGCSAITNLTLNEGLERIRSNSFTGLSNLKSINFPSTLSMIDDYAFQSLGLENLVIPSGAAINKYAFASMQNLTSVFVPANLRLGSNSGFILSGCKKLTDVTLEEGLTDTGGGMFYNCSALESIVLPTSMKKLGTYEFGGCKLLKNIDISNITEFGTKVFENCSSLTNIVLSEALTSIPSDAFLKSGLTSIIIPNNVTRIYSQAFRYAPLTDVVIGSGVTTIDANAFANCTSIERVKILATTPPTIQTTTFASVPTTCIYEVPAASVEAYKAKTNWSTLADQIVASEEF